MQAYKDLRKDKYHATGENRVTHRRAGDERHHHLGVCQRQFLGRGWQAVVHAVGIVSMVDLYVGFTLFSCWIIYREKSLVRSVIWVILMMTLGFFTGSLYAFIALQTSGGDWKRFWMGNRHGDA
jgi:hypothetical protein